MRGFSVLALSGLLAACGQWDVAPAENAGNALNDHMPAAMPNAAMPNEAATEIPANAADTAAPANGPAAAGKVTRLPLKPGYYVASDTPCGQASNATLLLMSGDGYGASRTACTFKTIEKTWATRYRVTEECSELGGFGGESEPQTSTMIYEIADDTHYATKSEGWESKGRYCPQSSLPEPWKTNDISDAG